MYVQLVLQCLTTCGLVKPPGLVKPASRDAISRLFLPALCLGAQTGAVSLRLRGAAVGRWFARRQSAFAYGAHPVYSRRPQDAGRAIRRRQQRLRGL